MISEIYDELKEAVVSEEKSKAVAQALENYENRFASIETDLALLKWIMHVLHNSGHWTMERVFVHFFGLSIAGTGLIMGCAWWGRRQAIKEKLIPDPKESAS